MATDQHPQSGRRPQFHRGRRGHERRDRRPSPAPQSQDQGQGQGQAEQADVDHIVKEIKARIAQRHGIDLSAQQIQELAARRLEAILDPRTVKPGLLDQLRKSAGAPAGVAPAEPVDAYAFEDHTIYDTHNGLLRFLRKLLAPILKLFFNPNPISAALNTQVRVNREAAKREAERERTQAEWNALHYTVLQRLVTEVSRVSLEMQSLALRVESLATRADFTERRIRSLEAPPAAPAPPARSFDAPAATPSGGGAPRSSEAGSTAEGQTSESKRRRRRRRGRRGNVPGGEPMGAGAPMAQSAADLAEGDDDGFDDGPEGAPENEAPEADDAPPAAATTAPSMPPFEPATAEPPAPVVSDTDTPAPAEPPRRFTQVFDSPPAPAADPADTAPPAPEPTDR